MSRFVEFVKYRLKATSEEEFLQLRSVAITEVTDAHPALGIMPEGAVSQQ